MLIMINSPKGIIDPKECFKHTNSPNIYQIYFLTYHQTLTVFLGGVCIVNKLNVKILPTEQNNVIQGKTECDVIPVEKWLPCIWVSKHKRTRFAGSTLEINLKLALSLLSHKRIPTIGTAGLMYPS